MDTEAILDLATTEAGETDTDDMFLEDPREILIVVAKLASAGVELGDQPFNEVNQAMWATGTSDANEVRDYIEDV